MRIVHFFPGFSSWWIMNPGILLYYDKLVISQEDYKDICDPTNSSQFHMYSKNFFDLLNKEFPNLVCIEDFKNQDIDYNLAAKNLVDEIFDIANDNNQISFDEILDITIEKYEKWINFNKFKCSTLPVDDDYRIDLEKHHIHKWESYLVDIKNIRSVKYNDFYKKFKETPSAIGSFTRLISTSLHLIDLNKKGITIYDPMMNDYLPGISLVNKVKNIKDNIPLCNDFYKAFDSKKNITILNDNKEINKKRFFETIYEYKKVRLLLEKLDNVIINLEYKDIIEAAKVNREIRLILKDIKKLNYYTDLGCWILSFISYLGFLLNPKTNMKLKDFIYLYYIHNKKFGEVIGTYLTVYSSLLSIQDIKCRTAQHCSYNKNRFKKSYDFYLNIIK